MEDLKIEYLSIDSLHPYEKNARKHTKDSVQTIIESIKAFGFRDPIGIWGKKNIVVEGHGRLMAAKELGMEKVPCIRLDDLTDEQRRAYTLAHNQTTDNSSFDFDALNAELADLDALDLDFDMEDFGFDMSFLEEDHEVVDDDYDVVVPEEARTKPGDIWQLGRHRLICGDATNINDIEKLMDGQKADLLLTDPPYNVSYEGGTKDKLKIMNDSMEDTAFREFLASAFETAKQCMKAGAAFYIWHADSEGYNFRGAVHDVGMTVRQCLIWVKNSLVLGRQDYQWKHEPCLYGWSDGGSHAWYSDRKQTTVLNFDRPTQNKEHPTMKPVPLFAYLIQNSTKQDDIVLDTFAGSGTTIIACEQLDRSGYCSELDPKYCDVIVDRWEKLTGEKAVLLNV